jgi:predicted PurR-regulated permease PerM
MPTNVLWPAARFALNALLIAAAVALAWWLVAKLWLIVVPVLIALLLSTLLVPPTDALRRRGWPSAVATLFVMLLSTSLLAGIIALIAPAFVDQTADLGQTVEEGIGEVLRWLSTGPLGIERDEVEDAVENAVDRVRDNAGTIGQGVLTGATVLAEVVSGLLLVIVLVFFFVHDGRGMWTWLVSLTPARHRELIQGAGEEVWNTTTAYVRGVAIIALVDAVLIGIALLLIGVPLVLPLMVLVFLGAFVPLIGAVIAGAVAALVALISDGAAAALLVVLAITVIQQLEGDLLYPNIVGRAIRLHGAAILLILTAGTVVAGILGALLSVPVAAAVWTAIAHVREARSVETVITGQGALHGAHEGADAAR